MMSSSQNGCPSFSCHTSGIPDARGPKVVGFRGCVPDSCRGDDDVLNTLLRVFWKLIEHLEDAESPYCKSVINSLEVLVRETVPDLEGLPEFRRVGSLLFVCDRFRLELSNHRFDADRAEARASTMRWRSSSMSLAGRPPWTWIVVDRRVHALPNYRS